MAKGLIRAGTAACIAVLATQAGGSEALPRIAVGLGMTDCGAVLALENRDGFRDRLAQWVAGFMTGLNAPLGDGKARDLSGFIPTDAAARIILGCRFEPPETRVLTIAIGQFNQLPAHRKP